MTSQQQPDYDVIAIGAGFAGLSLIHYIREAGLSIRVFDRADDIARHLDLESLPWRHDRQRELLLLTASRFRRNCCRSGPGRRATRTGKRHLVTSTSSLSAAT